MAVTPAANSAQSQYATRFSRAGRSVARLYACFRAPVRAGRHGGYAAASVSQLNAHVAADNDLYGTDGLVAVWHAVRGDISDGSLAALGERVRSLDDLTAAVEAHLRGTP